MPRNKLLLATTNQGKAKEIKSFLEELSLEIFTLQELNLNEIFQERGKTFSENARGKSLFHSEGWEGLTLAEDSGLEIEHLKGAPGVISARFSGPQATDEKNNKKVLELMKGVTSEKRKATFVSCMILAQKEKIIKEIKESVTGIITLKKRGNYGFGYDPIFYLPQLGRTMAELTQQEKNSISHRGQAANKARSFLLNLMDIG